MSKSKRAFAGILAILTFILFIFTGYTSIAYADEDKNKDSNVKKVNTSGQDRIDTSDKKTIILADTGAKAVSGKPGGKIQIELPLAVNREYIPSLNYILRNITIEPVIPTDRSDIDDWPFEIKNASYIKQLQDMTYNSRADVFYDFEISKTAVKGTYPIPFLVNATIWRKDEINRTQIKEDVEFNLIAYVNVTDDGSESRVTNELGALVIATVDKDGTLISAPSGDAGERVKLKLPIVNNGGTLKDINITPVISNSLEEWPFVVEVINYGKKLPNMNPGDIAALDYEFRISPEISVGAKPINFRATYKENGTMKESLFSAYINVANGKLEKVEPIELPDSIPKLMIIGYTTNPDEIYSGESFNLTLEFQNASWTKSIENVGIALTLAEEELMPAKGESDSAYIDHLGPGKTTTRTFKLKALPTAINPTSTIVANMNYETAKVTQGMQTQGIVLEIKQEIDIFIEAPTIYGEEYVINEPIAVTIPIINKGKSKILNLQIDVEGEGISMVEKFYGGDLLPAAKNSADFQISCDRAGIITGDFLIIYEDLDGIEIVQRLPFELEIKDENYLGNKIIQDEVKPVKDKGKLPVAAAEVGSIGAIGGGIYLYLKKIRDRK